MFGDCFKPVVHLSVAEEITEENRSIISGQNNTRKQDFDACSHWICVIKEKEGLLKSRNYY